MEEEEIVFASFSDLITDKKLQIKFMSLLIAFIIIVESVQSMNSLSKAVDEVKDPGQGTIVSQDHWLGESFEGCKSYDDPSHPFKNDAQYLVRKYAEFNDHYVG